MQSVGSALARIQEIQNRVGAKRADTGFQAVLDAELASGAAGASAVQAISTPTIGPVTIGELIGAVPGRVPATGVASGPELDGYLRGSGIDSRNGRLGPDELVAVSGGWNGRSGSLAPPAAAAWESMRAAAAADGIDLRFVDSYRSWAVQDAAHQRYVSGEKHEHVLPAGTSEHGLGLAVDITDGSLVGPGDPEWHWMQANAARFGWHPISNESWHWEFRGA